MQGRELMEGIVKLLMSGLPYGPVVKTFIAEGVGWIPDPGTKITHGVTSKQSF